MGEAGHIGSAPDVPVGPVDGPVPMALVFRAGALLCALPLEEVTETMRPLPVQPLAGTHPFVRGISIMRGVPTPVVDVALLLGGRPAAVTRFVSVHTDHGPAAFATGEVLGIREIGDAHAGRANAALLGGAPMRLVAAVATFDGGPLLVLRSARLLADQMWADEPRAAPPRPDELPADELPVDELPADELPVDELPADELGADVLGAGLRGARLHGGDELRAEELESDVAAAGVP